MAVPRVDGFGEDLVDVNFRHATQASKEQAFVAALSALAPKDTGAGDRADIHDTGRQTPLPTLGGETGEGSVGSGIVGLPEITYNLHHGREIYKEVKGTVAKEAVKMATALHLGVKNGLHLFECHVTDEPVPEDHSSHHDPSEGRESVADGLVQSLGSNAIGDVTGEEEKDTSVSHSREGWN